MAKPTMLWLKEQVDTVCRLANCISLDDAKALVDEIERTDTLMPFIDPTAYLQICHTLPVHLRVARAFLAFRRELEACLAEEASRG